MTDAWALRSDAASFGSTATALAAGDSEHLPTLLDVTALGERRELVLAPVDGPTLAALRACRQLAAGEAVTVVVSAARAVAAVHAAGYCGLDLADPELRFDGSGRPIVFGVQSVRETAQVGAEGRADDWRTLAALAERLGLLAQAGVGSVLGPQQAGLGLAIAAVAATESPEHLAQLDDALFDIAEPAPVRLDVDPVGSWAPAAPAAAPSSAEPLPPGPRAIAAAERAASHGHALHRRPSASALIEAFDAGPSALLAGPLERLRQATATARARLQGRARLAVIAGAAAVALTVALLAMVPSGPPARSAGSSAPTEAASETSEGPRGPAPNRASATPSQHSAADADDSVLGGDDPVAAAAVLVERRDACLAGAAGERADCFAQLGDGGASTLDQPARPLGALTPSLLERSGDSALIALTPTDPKTAPASALLMRTEAGWRLRQLYEN